MESSVEIITVTNLVLTEKETWWLKEKMKTPIIHSGNETETSEDTKYRQLFWNAVNNG